MKTNVITLIFATLLPMVASAQDDLYFTPKKKTAKTANTSEVPYAGNTYYSGIDKSVDDYNRRSKKAISTYNCTDSVMFSSDSIASDVITFSPSNPEELAQQPDTVVKYIYVHDVDDYTLCRYLSRFDDFYWMSRFYGPGWYDPWRWGYYNHWYNPYWVDPFFYNHWAFYDPWFYGPGYYPGYYPGFYPYYRPNVYYANRYGYSGTHNHGFGGNRETGFAHRTTTRTSGTSYDIANRNGSQQTYQRGARGNGYRSSRYENYNSNNTNRSTTYTNTYRPSMNSSSFSSSSGGFSGGHSSGGHSSGGHSGGGFGSHRR